MLDIKELRKNCDEIIKRLNTRGSNFDYLKNVVDLDEERRGIINQVEEMKAFRNSKSKEIGKVKAAGGDVQEILNEVSSIGNKINDLDTKLNEIELEINTKLLNTPNVPRGTIPVGEDESSNVVIDTWGTPRNFSFETKGHWDIAKDLDIIDFERAAKITGSRFIIYKGVGARLMRALAAYMIDKHTITGEYTEIIPPYIVNGRSLKGTGQLPKFEEDLFKLKETDYYLIPTAEVPITNMHSDEIVDVNTPISYCGFTPCFRSEAGSAGRDTRGIIRLHQFNKVELVKFTKPEDSYKELERLTMSAESILQDLELPYRKLNLCTGDIGFSAALTYDLEVWLPSYDNYKEISSCSNFEDFQARRANIRYRDEEGKLNFVHTINGSGLAIGRTVAAIVENYQNEDGSITVPKVLVPYVGIEVIK